MATKAASKKTIPAKKGKSSTKVTSRVRTMKEKVGPVTVDEVKLPRKPAMIEITNSDTGKTAQIPFSPEMLQDVLSYLAKPDQNGSARVDKDKNGTVYGNTIDAGIPQIASTKRESVLLNRLNFIREELVLLAYPMAKIQQSVNLIIGNTIKPMQSPPVFTNNDETNIISDIDNITRALVDYRGMLNEISNILQETI